MANHEISVILYLVTNVHNFLLIFGETSFLLDFGERYSISFIAYKHDTVVDTTLRGAPNVHQSWGISFFL